MRPIGPQHSARGFTLIEMVIVIAILAALAAIVVPMVGASDDHSKETATRASMAAVRDGFLGSGAEPGMYSDLRYVENFSSSGLNNLSDLRIAHLIVKPEFPSAPLIPDYDNATRKGWRGPYVRGGFVLNTAPNSGSNYPALNNVRFDGDSTFGTRGFHTVLYGVPGEAAVGDAWGNPLILQIPSTKPDGTTFTSSIEAWKYARIVSAGPNGKLDTVLGNSDFPSEPQAYNKALAGKKSDNSTPARGDDIVLFLNRADVYE